MRHIVELTFLYAGLFLAIVAVVLATPGCLSLDQGTKDDVKDVIDFIPTPRPTPAPPTPTPLPTPTPKPPDLSVGRIQHDLPEFAKAKGIPVVATSRGNMLDMRGRADFDAIFTEWCEGTSGASLPAITDKEPHGIFHQCD